MISFQSICQSARKLWATSDQASSEPSARARAVRRRRVVLVAAGGVRACSRASSSRLPADEQPQHRPHQPDHHEAADELGECELPAEQHPQHEPELPDQVRGGELERERRGSGRALLEQALRDRDRGVRARGRGRAEARGLGIGASPSPRAPTGCARAAPRPERPRRSRSRARAPTRPPTPSARRSRGHRQALRERCSYPNGCPSSFDCHKSRTASALVKR